MIGKISAVLFVAFIFFVVITILHKLKIFKFLGKGLNILGSSLSYEKRRKSERRKIKLSNIKSRKINDEL